MVEFDPRNCKPKTAFYCDEKEIAGKIIILFLMCFMVLLSVGGNLLVIITTVTFSYLHKNVTNLFIFSLALADLLIGISGMPFFTMKYINCDCWYYGFTLCRLYIANDALLSTVSITHLLCISVDRYIAVIYPLNYASTMTRKRVIIIIIISWIYSLLLTHIPIHTNIYITNSSANQFQQDDFYCGVEVNRIYCIISALMCFFLPAIAMCVLYYRIFRVAKRHENRLFEMIGNCIRKQTINSLDDAIFGSGKLYTEEFVAQRQQRKSTKMVAIVIGCFFLCWLGFFINYLIIFALKVTKFPSYLFEFSFIMGYLNACINPFIYTFYHESFRKSFKSLLICRQATSVTTMRPSNLYAKFSFIQFSENREINNKILNEKKSFSLENNVENNM